ncbi:LOW QUALITY PROTEIN: hypothetical protein Cgig2_004909 [Carnegiea gigantea]|uniref:Uncharacterized protein n=1 Tax=Carnegiea gigantea TaxID=171969 RepID=A0A9Q1KZV6_9CARY|nr:LOW QUALITY PROTEIN: hypothetical protein Cgig2_004909 [Carnegiea gigantea]
MLNRSRGHHSGGLRGRNNSVGLESSTQKRGTKFKSLEVDFLVVDVPTAYNCKSERDRAINRRELQLFTTKTKTKNKTNTNKTKGAKKRQGAGATRWAPTILMLLSLRSTGLSFHGVDGLVPGNLALIQRGDKLHLLRVATLRGGPLALVHVVKVGLEVIVILKLFGQGQHDLTEVPEGVGAALLVALLLNLDRINRSLLQTHRRPDPPVVFRSAVGTARQAPPAVGTLQQPSPLEEDLGHGYFFFGHLGGIRSSRSYQIPGFNYVLDKTELGGRVCLDELRAAEQVGRGRRLPGSRLLQLWKGRRAVAWPGFVPLMTGSPIGEGPIARLSLPPLAMARRPRPHPTVPQSFASY